MERERKERKKAKEKERKERLRKEGKLLTEKQKHDRARMMQTLAALQAQGVQVPPMGGQGAMGASVASGGNAGAGASNAQDGDAESPREGVCGPPAPPGVSATKKKPKYDRLRQKNKQKAPGGTNASNTEQTVPTEEVQGTGGGEDAPATGDDGVVENWEDILLGKCMPICHPFRFISISFHSHIYHHWRLSTRTRYVSRRTLFDAVRRAAIGVHGAQLGQE